MMKRVMRLAKEQEIRLTVAVIALICALSLPSVVHGQWAVSATNPNDINNTNTGKVGIGINSPNATLHVKSATSSVLKFDRFSSNTFGFEIGTAGSIFGLYDYTTALWQWRVAGGNLLLLEAGSNFWQARSLSSTQRERTTCLLPASHMTQK